MSFLHNEVTMETSQKTEKQTFRSFLVSIHDVFKRGQANFWKKTSIHDLRENVVLFSLITFLFSVSVGKLLVCPLK